MSINSITLIFPKYRVNAILPYHHHDLRILLSFTSTTDHHLLVQNNLKYQSQYRFKPSSVKMQVPRNLFILLTTIFSLVLILNPFQPVSAHIHTEVPENVRKMAFLLHEHCVKETGIDEDWSLQMIRGTMPEDRSFGCYLHCMFNTVGLVSPEGHIRFQDIMHLLPARHQEIIADVTEKCDTIREFSCA